MNGLEEQLRELQEKTDRLDAGLMMALGNLKAMEYGIRSLMVSHPQPSEALELWNALLPGMVDAHVETMASNPAMYQAGLQAGLAVLTGQLEENLKLEALRQSMRNRKPPNQS